MHTTDSPEKCRATGAQSRRHGDNENSDAQQILDRALQGNCREIIRREPTSERSLMECGRNREKLWAVHSAHRIDHYLVEQGDRSWKYSLLWSALSKFDRLCRNGGQA